MEMQLKQRDEIAHCNSRRTNQSPQRSFSKLAMQWDGERTDARPDQSDVAADLPHPSPAQRSKESRLGRNMSEAPPLRGDANFGDFSRLRGRLDALILERFEISLDRLADIGQGFLS